MYGWMYVCMYDTHVRKLQQLNHQLRFCSSCHCAHELFYVDGTHDVGLVLIKAPFCLRLVAHDERADTSYDISTV
jgi:hypothetical protein